MWRGYGNNSGIAIGFDFAQCSSIPGFSMMRKEQYEHELKKHNNNPEQMVPSHEIRLFGTNVIYDKEQKKELISEVLNMGLEHFNFMQSHSPSTSMISARNYLTDSLFSLFPFIKNEAFKNEEECRVVENYARSTGEVPLNVYYRQRNGISLPYIRYALLDINCRPIKQWPISEIVIGPGLRQYDLAESIKYFLSQQGMQDLSEKVVLSEIPFVASI